MKTLLLFLLAGSLSGTPVTKVVVGHTAPELEMTTPQGKTATLSSLRGDVVLIDFWASWCRPCRVENRNLVKTYHHFHDKDFKGGGHFQVFSVSLDKQKNAWEQAIEQDGLVWPYHVSDLGGWHSDAAKLYNINSIPSNVLIDQNGVIIAMNLRGKQLDEALEKLVK